MKEAGPLHVLTQSDPGVLTFRDNLSVLSSRVNLDFLTLKMTGDRLFGSDSCSMLHTVSKTRRYINPLQTKSRPLYLKTQSVPRSKHFSSRL